MTPATCGASIGRRSLARARTRFGLSRHGRSFVTFYIKRYSDLQERWYGRPGEAAEYAASLLQSPGGDDGKIAYVAVSESALDFENNPSKLPGFSGVSYARLIEAFGVRQRVVGLTNHDWNVLMFYACAALDRNGVRFTAKKIGDRWEKDLCGAKDYYDSWAG
jgi:hypothetical protein